MSSLRGPMMWGKRARSASITAAVSSTDSVVWETKAMLSGSRTASAWATFASGAAVALDFEMHCGHQWASGGEHLEPALRRRFAHGLGNAVSAEDHDIVVGHLVQFFDEHHALGAQTLRHELVVHHFMPHIHGRTEQLKGALHDIDGAIHAGAKTAGIGEMNLHGWFTRHRVAHCTGFRLKVETPAKGRYSVRRRASSMPLHDIFVTVGRQKRGSVYCNTQFSLYKIGKTRRSPPRYPAHEEGLRPLRKASTTFITAPTDIAESAILNAGSGIACRPTPAATRTRPCTGRRCSTR